MVVSRRCITECLFYGTKVLRVPVARDRQLVDIAHVFKVAQDRTQILACRANDTVVRTDHQTRIAGINKQHHGEFVASIGIRLFASVTHGLPARISIMDRSLVSMVSISDVDRTRRERLTDARDLERISHRHHLMDLIPVVHKGRISPGPRVGDCPRNTAILVVIHQPQRTGIRPGGFQQRKSVTLWTRPGVFVRAHDVLGPVMQPARHDEASPGNASTVKPERLGMQVDRRRPLSAKDAL
jgi:hypothetical protein